MARASRVIVSSADVPSLVRDVLQTPGEPLDPGSLMSMESRFNHDFSGVRVHADRQAATSADAIGARAYTYGPNIVMNDGEYRPDSMEGRQLLAHELAHVVQQSRRGGTDSTALEQEAARAGDTAASDAGDIRVHGAGAPRLAAAPAKLGTNYAGDTTITIELPPGSSTPGRAGYEAEFRALMPPNVVEDTARWHAAHAVGQGIGVELRQGILLAPDGVNLSVQGAIERRINQFREVVPKGGKLLLQIETGAHADGIRLKYINYELVAVREDGERARMMSCSVQVSDDRERPEVNIGVESSQGKEATRHYPDAFNAQRQRWTPEDKKKPMQAPTDGNTYSATGGTLKRSKSESEVVNRYPNRPAGGTAPVSPKASSSGASTKNTPDGQVSRAMAAVTSPAAVSPAPGSVSAANKAPQEKAATTAPSSSGKASATAAQTAPSQSARVSEPRVELMPWARAEGELPDPAPPTNAAKPSASIAPTGAQPPSAARSTSASQQQRGGGAAQVPAKKSIDPATGAALMQGAAMILSQALTWLDDLSRTMQNEEARGKIAAIRREVIDALRLEPGVGAVIEVQFLEPEHILQDVTWRRTTDRYVGKPTRVLNEANKQPVSTFIMVQPTADPKEAGAPAGSTAREVKSSKDFIESYMTARGADLSTPGMVAVEMYDALARGYGTFGFTDVVVGTTTLRITDPDRRAIEPALATVAEKAVRARLEQLNHAIAFQQTRLEGRLQRWRWLSGNVELTGHELDRARAHHAAAATYLKDGKYGLALESVKGGEAQVQEVADTIHEDTYGRRPD
jgi:Domain of unknown function (DUF4157)